MSVHDSMDQASPRPLAHLSLLLLRYHSIDSCTLVISNAGSAMVVVELRPRRINLLHRVVATCLGLVLHSMLNVLMADNRGVQSTAIEAADAITSAVRLYRMLFTLPYTSFQTGCGLIKHLSLLDLLMVW